MAPLSKLILGSITLPPPSHVAQPGAPTCMHTYMHQDDHGNAAKDPLRRRTAPLFNPLNLPARFPLNYSKTGVSNPPKKCWIYSSAAYLQRCAPFEFIRVRQTVMR